MANPRAFLSFDFDHDADYRVMLSGQGKAKSPTPYIMTDWSSKAALPQAQWETSIKAKINQCNLMIVLVGQYMGTAKGVATEIGMAKSQNVPYFGIYVHGANTSSILPTGLARNRIVSWKWDEIGSAIKQTMKEGKNKK